MKDRTCNGLPGQYIIITDGRTVALRSLCYGSLYLFAEIVDQIVVYDHKSLISGEVRKLINFYVRKEAYNKRDN